MKKYLFLILIGISTTLNAQKIKLENPRFVIESYPKIILPTEIKTYRIKISNNSNTKHSQQFDTRIMKRNLKFHSMKLTEDFADLTIEFIINNEIFLRSESDNAGNPKVVYRMNNKVKIYTKDGNLLYDGSVSDFYDSSLGNTYTRSASGLSDDTKDHERNLNNETQLAGKSLRQRFELNYASDQITFMRIKGDEKYEILVDRVIDFLHKDTLLTGTRKNIDSLELYMKEMSSLKKPDEDSEYNKKYNMSVNANLSLLLTLLERFDEAEAIQGKIEKSGDKDYALSRQKSFLRERKKNYEDYISCLEKFNGENYNPYINKK